MKNPVFLSACSFTPSSPVGEIVFRLNRRSETTNAAAGGSEYRRRICLELE